MVLLLPKWWPDEVRFHRGLFNRKHALAVLPQFRVACIYVHESDKRFIANDEDGIFTVRIGIGEIRGAMKGLRKWWKMRAAYKRGYLLVKAHLGKPHLLHAQVLLSPVLFAWWMSKFLHIPFIISEHWSGYITGEYKRLGSFKKMLTRKLVRKARRVLTPSRALADAMQSRGLKGHYEVVQNVVERVKLNKPSQRNDDKVRLMNLSDMWDDKKNVSGLIRAVAAVIQDDPRIELTIIGDGRDREILVALATELNVLDKHVFFRGELPNAEIYEFMKAIDYYVMNSRVETFGIAIVEAIACGKPVIATDCGGPSEFVTDEVGILIQPDNEVALREAILKMANTFRDYNPEQLMNYAAERFNPQVVGELLAQHYRRCMV